MLVVLTECASISGVYKNHSDSLEQSRGVGNVDTLLDCIT